MKHETSTGKLTGTSMQKQKQTTMDTRIIKADNNKYRDILWTQPFIFYQPVTIILERFVQTSNLVEPEVFRSSLPAKIVSHFVHNPDSNYSSQT